MGVAAGVVYRTPISTGIQNAWEVSRGQAGTAGIINLFGRYPTCTVDQRTALGGYEAAPQGCIYFAGDACTLGLTGFMEGAARAGERARPEAAAALNEPDGFR